MVILVVVVGAGAGVDSMWTPWRSGRALFFLCKIKESTFVEQ